ncbi:SpoIIE family protein phosphatase [Aliiroseovarius sp. F20344]|uniref:PP2C family protein-serine/threonine phosphatase n=1 Tax=Aliiroseovarius sp. F20344 TaxID=2926414 RepID=UPI001FF55947|nr:SpoIIE family protein phosphatase [Aliiroseovarius sp. F20344]MCK0141376.1 SpoIIE family protein phosphatase [Aliiroseovarius sp. F20344]
MLGESVRTDSVQRILVVDDSRAQRSLMSKSLSRQGYEVEEADSGLEALKLFASQEFDLVLSDWMMPGMDGLELCKAIRAHKSSRYVYFILLTSKTDKGAVARGLDVGADDFLAKPFNPDELRARIAAGGRILSMERELQETNRLVSSALTELKTLYDSVDRDLVEARKMQQSLVRESFRDWGRAEVSLLLKPCGHVGGDLVGFFDAGEDHIAFYSIDVSGHGIASALLTARLASYLSEGSPTHNIALIENEDGNHKRQPPEIVAAQLNTLLTKDMLSEHYFTMLFGYLDMTAGKVEFTQCGHPNAVVLNRSGQAQFVGQGGMPIGLISAAEFERQIMTLQPGERLIFYSDGFTECEDTSGNQIEEQGFGEILEKNSGLTNDMMFDAMVWDLDRFAGGEEFGDDLSCVMLTYKSRT